VACASLAMAGIAYLPFVFLTLPSQAPSAEAIGSMVALSVVSTALAFVAFFGLIAEAGPSRAMVFTYVNPAVAVVAGVLVLDEKVTTAMLVAFPLIIVGSVLATRASRPPKTDAVVHSG
jgi:drug/metabolite transporter (DMT)-like permease